MLIVLLLIILTHQMVFVLDQVAHGQASSRYTLALAALELASVC